MIDRKINYPKSFIKKVKEIYPDWKDLHSAIDLRKRKKVGEMLDNASNFQITYDEIIDLFRSERQLELLNRANRAKERKNLYLHFLKIEDSFCLDLEDNE